MAKKDKHQEIVDKDLFTVSEASKISGMDPHKILYRIKTGKIKAQKLGWMWIIPPEYVETLSMEMEVKRRGRELNKKEE